MKRGQVWLETVVYTMIGLSLIAIVLAIVTPKINEQRDRAVIEQTISSLNSLDSKIREITAAPGNVRVLEFNLKRGDLYIDGENNGIYFEMADSRSLFSEPGVTVGIGRINVTTTEGASRHSVRLNLGYNFDLKYGGENSIERISASSIPYRISIENKGFENGVLIIDVRRVS